MLHTFIDTNVYLTFFSFAEDDLEELRKLRVAIDNEELTLWTTTHVLDELQRNRESKIAESMEALRKLKPSGQVPQMAKNLDEFDAFGEARKTFGEQLNVLHDRLSEEAATNALAADRLLNELLDAAETVEIDEELIGFARRRLDVGNPPGKRGSLGDAINWEALLAKCPNGADLLLITQDRDFVSRLDSDRVSGFLEREWRDAKESGVYL